MIQGVERMFKRILVCGTIASCLLSGAALANGYKGEGSLSAPMSSSLFHPYVGLSYVYLHNSYKSSVTETIGSSTTTFSPNATSPNNFSGLSFSSGFKYGKYIGMEFGYAQFGSKNQTAQTTTTTYRPKAGYVDFRAYYPIEQFDLIGVAGFAMTSLGDAKVVNTTSGTTSTLGADDSVVPRLGLGVDYNFNDNWGIRALGKYSFVNSRYVNSAYTLEAGFFYNFTA